MKEIEVSVCVITYNHENYIRECLDGILMQKVNFNYEILINDDASTDATQSIIKQYQRKYPEQVFPIFQKKNQFSQGVRGINFRFNFPRARGKYIALCEGDDYWTDPRKLSIQLAFLEDNPDYSLCFHNVKVIKNVKGRKPEERLFKDYSKNEFDGRDVLRSWLIPTASIVFRNIGHQNFPSFTTEFTFGDLSLQLTLAEYGKLALLPQTMSVYRINDSSITIRNINEPLHYRENIRQLKTFDEFFHGKYKKEIKDRIFVINCSLVNAYKNKSLKQQFYWFKKAVKNSSLKKDSWPFLYNSIKALAITCLTKTKLEKA